jgi:catechol 2,3-dioxygenase-like lactoylglutathione lyase family enzyme
MNDVAAAQRERTVRAARIAPSKFAHVVLRTANYAAVVDWYATVLQARIVLRSPFIAFLTYDDEHHRVAVINAPDSRPVDDGAAGVHHIAYTHATLGDLLATYRRLRDEGIEPVRCINHGPTTSMYYRDPDGLRVELQIDNFATTEELHAYFASQEFADNPIGVLFDPEQLIRDYEAGTPLAELVRRPPLPEGVTPLDMRRERPRP